VAGRAWKFGDDVDTDVIIPARYLNVSDPEELARHCMEDADPDFAGRVRPGDVIVAGKNFGCGSSREHAPLAIKACGVACVVAASFARIFYRNAFNIGLPILECPEAAERVAAGDVLEIDLAAGLIRNRTRNEEYRARPVPEFMREIVAAGGLVPFVARRLAEKGRV
jgi:3-isopropylmalate dehydratase small subunit